MYMGQAWWCIPVIPEFGRLTRTFFLLLGLGFEFRALGLQSRCPIATPPVHFPVVILEMGSHFVPRGLAWNHHPPDLSLPKPPWPAVGYNEVSGTFCLGTSILPISASQVGRITSMSHQPGYFVS
jgi:hypothetical protein